MSRARRGDAARGAAISLFNGIRDRTTLRRCSSPASACRSSASSSSPTRCRRARPARCAALVKRSTRSLPACALVGVAAGALVQSTSAVVTVLGSTTSAGMTTLRQAIPIVAFANVGTTALVFAGSLDIRVAGPAGARDLRHRLFPRRASSAGRPSASIALGVALLLYGSDLMGTAASDVQGAGWFASFLGPGMIRRRWPSRSAPGVVSDPVHDGDRADDDRDRERRPRGRAAGARDDLRRQPRVDADAHAC